MSTWEYRRESYKVLEGWQNPELGGIREVEGLNRMGAAGWEVVNFINGPGNHFSYVLKRQLS